MPGDTKPKQSGKNQALTDDLVRKVADKIYTKLMHDLEIERERQRPSSIHTLSTGGGW
jgi:hypothetical protein